MHNRDQNEPRRPAVIIASSTEGLEVARALEAQLERYAEVTLWCDGLFGLSSSTLESLVQACQRFDAAALVLTPDDDLESRGRLFQVPRDNLLFELGLFMGRIGRHRTYIVYCRDDDVKLPSDLAGIVAATYARRKDEDLLAALGPVAFKIQLALRKSDLRDEVTLSFVDVICSRLKDSYHRERIGERLSHLPDLAAARVWVENRVDVERIADQLISFENRGWTDRPLVVFFGQHATSTTTLRRLKKT